MDDAEYSNDVHYDMTDPYEIARYIKNSIKSTPVKAYVSGTLEGCDFGNIECYGNSDMWILFGESDQIRVFLDSYASRIKKYRIECGARNSAVPLLDIEHTDARIEPGAIIRDRVKIGSRAVIMMGAVINIGAEIGDGTMVDMNAVVGARGKLGRNVHLGAGAVIAGVLEPPSSQNVIIGDDVLIGANAVVLEGVRVGRGAVVAAGAVVTNDVKAGTVVAGAPAKMIKFVDNRTRSRTKTMDDLRK